MMHSLKTWPIYYNRVVSGEKQFEMRNNDRDFQTGDTVQLEEFDPVTGIYTGRQASAKIGYILHSHDGLYSDYVVFQLVSIYIIHE